MSSFKKETGSMSVRIDDEVVEWITIAKDAFKASNMSEAIRLVFLRAYPDMPQVAEKFRQKEDERESMLAEFIKSDD